MMSNKDKASIVFEAEWGKLSISEENGYHGPRLFRGKFLDYFSPAM